MMKTRAAAQADEVELLRSHGRDLLRRINTAVALTEAHLVEHGSTRHPLVDALLDVRNALRVPTV